jgi:hypothetical protein
VGATPLSTALGGDCQATVFFVARRPGSGTKQVRMDERPGRRADGLTFEAALAEALERGERGEPLEAIAADYPEHQLLPYLELALRLSQLGDRPWPISD